MDSVKNLRLIILSCLLILASTAFVIQIVFLCKISTKKRVGEGEKKSYIDYLTREKEEASTKELKQLLFPSRNRQIEEIKILKDKIAKLDNEKKNLEKRSTILSKKDSLAKAQIQQQGEELQKKMTEWLQEKERVSQQQKHLVIENTLIKSKAGEAENRLTVEENESLHLQEELLALQGKMVSLKNEKETSEEASEEEKKRLKETEETLRAEYQRVSDELAKEQNTKKALTEEVDKVEQEITQLLDAQVNESQKSIAQAREIIDLIKSLGVSKYESKRLKNASNLLDLAEKAANKQDYARSISLANEAISQAQTAEELYYAQKNKDKSALLERCLHLLTIWAY